MNDYKNTGITAKIYSDHIKEALHGGTSWGTDSDEGWFEYSSGRGLELSNGPFTKPFLKLSHSEIISIVNEILYENSAHKQLTLF